MIRTKEEFERVFESREGEIKDVIMARIQAKMHRDRYEVHEMSHYADKYRVEMRVTAYRNDKPINYILRIIYAFRGEEHGFPIVYIHVFFDDGTERTKKRMMLDIPNIRFNGILMKHYNYSSKTRSLTIVEPDVLRNYIDLLVELVRSLTTKLIDYDSVPETPDDRP